MQVMMVDLQKLIFPANEVTGALVRMKTGLTTALIKPPWIMGPDFMETVSSDYDLEREKLLDRLPPHRLNQLAAEADRLAKRVLLEKVMQRVGR